MGCRWRDGEKKEEMRKGVDMKVIERLYGRHGGWRVGRRKGKVRVYVCQWGGGGGVSCGWKNGLRKTLIY